MRTWRTIISLAITVCIAQNAFTQIAEETTKAGDLPKIVPPSPEVASLARVAQMSTSLHTGAASASLPLYTLTAGPVSLPLQLTYSTNGLKVTDIPSRVGMGWNLSAGGSISRIIHDEADGESDFLAPPASFGTVDQNLVDYLDAATEDNNDTEHDEYSISAAGLSGKFFYDVNGNPRFTTHSNLKIERTGGSGAWVFIITDPQGIKYYFGEGGKVEKTKDVQANSYSTKAIVQTTGWFLTRIVSPEQHSISFTYDTISIRTEQGPFQTVTLKPTANSDGDCNFCAGSIPAVGYNDITYKTHFLTGISTSNGQSVNFTYGSRGDAGGDNRLTGVLVTADDGAGNTLQVKKYALTYENNNTSGTNHKFYLKKLHTLSSGSPVDTLTHTLDYMTGTLPVVNSHAQDYFGYYNGIGGTNFFPNFPGDDDYVNGTQGINRAPDFTYAVYGALKRITYPTGGFDEFEYEPHDILQYQDNYDVDEVDISGSGYNMEDPHVMTQYFQTTNQYVSPIHIHTFPHPSGPTPGHPHYNPANNIDRIVTVKIFTATYIPQQVFSAVIRNYVYEEFWWPALPNAFYRLEVTVKGSSNAAHVWLTVGTDTTVSAMNVTACGIRVKKIKSYDPLADKFNTKFYKYAPLADPDKSSGVGLLKPAFTAPSHQGGWCTSIGLGSQLIQCSANLQVSSSSLMSYYTFNGSPIAYSHVVESDDSTFANGATEHEFITYYAGTGASPLLNHTIFNAPVSIHPDMNGMEKRTTVYKRQSSSFLKLKEVAHMYSFDSTFSYYQLNTMVRKRFGGEPGNTFMEKVAGYDAGQYLLRSGWIRHDTTKTIEYDMNGQNPMEQVDIYDYNNSTHLQPTTVKSLDSQGDSIIVTSRYPHDYGSAPYTTLVSSHIITPVIEKKIKKNISDLVTIQTDFKNYHNNEVLRPEIVKSKKGTASFENRARYYRYDTLGNIVEMAKENDKKIVYLWDYQQSFPVAEVENADSTLVAYTSFESANKGGWTFSGSSSLHPSAPTGGRAYSLAGGNITRAAGTEELTYVVTFWKRDSAGTVTVNSTSPTALVTKNGWTLYRYTTTTTGAITIAGTGFIDEVRFHPSDALMSTMTYLPHIGVTTKNDAANAISYYEYDKFNRLLLIKDQDKNVLKVYDYKHQQTQNQ